MSVAGRLSEARIEPQQEGELKGHDVTGITIDQKSKISIGLLIAIFSGITLVVVMAWNGRSDFWEWEKKYREDKAAKDLADSETRSEMLLQMRLFQVKIENEIAGLKAEMQRQTADRWARRDMARYREMIIEANKGKDIVFPPLPESALK